MVFRNELNNQSRQPRVQISVWTVEKAVATVFQRHGMSVGLSAVGCSHWAGVENCSTHSITSLSRSGDNVVATLAAATVLLLDIFIETSFASLHRFYRG